MLLSAWGCARPLGFVFPFRREPTPTVESLVGPLRQRSKPVETVLLRARVTVHQPGSVGKGTFDASVFVQPPDHFRLRAFQNVSFLVFDLLADADGLRLHDATEKRYYAATYDTLRKANSPWGGLTPSLLIRALTVEQAVLDGVALARSASVRRRWNTIELRLETAEEHIQVVFDRTGRQIVGLTHERATGEKPMRIQYGEMMEVEGVQLPRWAELRIDSSRLRMRLNVSEYKINKTPPPKVFSLEAPAGQPWLPLEKRM